MKTEKHCAQWLSNGSGMSKMVVNTDENNENNGNNGSDDEKSAEASAQQVSRVFPQARDGFIVVPSVSDGRSGTSLSERGRYTESIVLNDSPITRSRVSPEANRTLGLTAIQFTDY